MEEAQKHLANNEKRIDIPPNDNDGTDTNKNGFQASNEIKILGEAHYTSDGNTM